MIQLSDHFNYKHLLRFTMPSIIMLIFTSVYGVVDGFFVSNFVGKTAFTAVNFVIPILLVLGCVGFMFGTGGGALIALTMGSGRKDKANGLFSLLIYASVICGIILTIEGSCSFALFCPCWAPKGSCLKTAWNTAGSSCWQSLPISFNMNFNVCSLPRRNLSWDYT